MFVCFSEGIIAIMNAVSFLYNVKALAYRVKLSNSVADVCSYSLYYIATGQTFTSITIIKNTNNV